MKNPIGTIFVEKRSNARRRGIEWGLTLEQFQQIVMQQNYIDGRGRERHCLHIDRIDVSLGYVWGNIQILTCMENVIKGNQERRKSYVSYFADEPDPF